MAIKENILKYLLSILIFSFSFGSLACEKIKTAYIHLLSTDFVVDKSFVMTMVIITSTKDDKTYKTYFHYNIIDGILSPIKTVIKGEVSMLFMSWKITSIENYSKFKLL